MSGVKQGRAMRTLLRDAQGTSVIELAMIAPFLGMMIIGIADLGQGLSASFALRQAVHRSIEIINVRPVVANPQTGDVDYSFVKQEAANAANVPLANVTMTQWLQCAGTAKTDYDTVCDAGQETARYLRISVTGSYEPSFTYGPLGEHFAGARPDGSIPLFAEAAVRIQ